MAPILIIGGGIAGTATALALQKAGLEATVYEAHPDSAEDIGAFLTLASNGMRALAQVDAAEAVAAVGFPLTAMRVVDGSGALVADVPLGDHDVPPTRFRCLLRGELNQALQREARRRGIGIRHSARLVGCEEGPAGVTVTFADGSSATGDLLIGADGLNSTVRTLVHPAAPGSRYAGQRVFYGYTDDAAPETGPERITMVRSHRAAFGYAVSPAGEVHWFARVSGDPVPVAEIAHRAPKEWRDELVPLLRGDDTPAADIVAATGDRLMVTNACDLPLGTPWRSARTVLVGDAAHAASPATGQGASMALEDAVVLAKALRDTGTTQAALALYEQLRRPRVDHNTTASARLTAGEGANGVDAVPDDDRRRQGQQQSQERAPQRPVSHIDAELTRQLDWDTRLSAR
jgi:2-polyprenyl-6-methoxyphenol hydroxylase-like FAD-dependent oxidoreductase